MTGIGTTRGLATIAAAVLIAGSLAAQEPAAPIAEPEAAPVAVEGTSPSARQIIEIHTPPRDVLRDTLLVVLGGVITGVVGLIAGWLLFRHERKEKRRTIAAVLVAELNHVLAMVDTSLEASADPQAAIGNLRLLENRDRVHKAVLPQIGELGVKNANNVINLYWLMEALVMEANSIDIRRLPAMSPSEISDCFERAKQLRDEARELHRSLINQFLRSQKTARVIEAVDGDRLAGPSS